MKPLQVYLPEAFIKHLKQKALNDGCSVSDLVRDALGADNDVLLTNKIVVPKVIKEPVKQPEKLTPALAQVKAAENPTPEGQTITIPNVANKPFTFPPSAASNLDIIKTPEQAKKIVENPQFIDKKYSARKPGSKERHVEL